MGVLVVAIVAVAVRIYFDIRKSSKEDDIKRAIEEGEIDNFGDSERF